MLLRQIITLNLESRKPVDIEALEKLIKNGESPTLELKVAPPRSSEMAERICGFANSPLGGTLVIGVEDQTLEIRGVKSVADAIDNLLVAARLCKPVVPLVPPQPQVFEFSGKHLVVAQVPPNSGELYQAGNVFWLRRGTHTVGMEKRELLDFVYRQGIATWETQPLTNATLEDLDLEKFREFVEQRPERNRRGGRLSDLNRLLLNLKCAAHLPGSEELCPTNAGMLLFGKDPQSFFTQAEIIATYYQDTSGVRRYSDRKILTGTLAEQIDQAEEYLKLRIPVPARVEGFHRVDEPELPLEALREAVVNAVVHRDYSIEGTAVRLFFYADRVEIYNPGLLMPGVSLDELREGRANSRPRNPVLASILRELPGGYMERMGSGIKYMIEQMRQHGLPEPEFKEQGDFGVTFWRARADEAIPVTKPVKTPETGEVSQVILKKPERLELIMRFVREHGSITSGQYRQLTGVGETTATRDLEELVAQGTLQATGSKKGRRYSH